MHKEGLSNLDLGFYHKTARILAFSGAALLASVSSTIDTNAELKKPFVADSDFDHFPAILPTDPCDTTQGPINVNTIGEPRGGQILKLRARAQSQAGTFYRGRILDQTVLIEESGVTNRLTGEFRGRSSASNNEFIYILDIHKNSSGQVDHLDHLIGICTSSTNR